MDPHEGEEGPDPSSAPVSSLRSRWENMSKAGSAPITTPSNGGKGIGSRLPSRSGLNGGGMIDEAKMETRPSTAVSNSASVSDSNSSQTSPRGSPVPSSLSNLSSKATTVASEISPPPYAPSSDRTPLPVFQPSTPSEHFTSTSVGRPLGQSLGTAPIPTPKKIPPPVPSKATKPTASSQNIIPTKTTMVKPVINTSIGNSAPSPLVPTIKLASGGVESAQFAPAKMVVISPSPISAQTELETQSGEEETEGFQSVSSLRSKFGGSTNVSTSARPGPARVPSPSPSFHIVPPLIASPPNVDTLDSSSRGLTDEPELLSPPPIPPNRPSLSPELNPPSSASVKQPSNVNSSSLAKGVHAIKLQPPSAYDQPINQVSPGGQSAARTEVIFPTALKPPPPVPPPRSRSPISSSIVNRDDEPYSIPPLPPTFDPSAVETSSTPTPQVIMPARHKPPVPSRTPSSASSISSSVPTTVSLEGQSKPPLPVRRRATTLVSASSTSSSAGDLEEVLTSTPNDYTNVSIAPPLPTRSRTLSGSGIQSEIASSTEDSWVPPPPPPMRSVTIKRDSPRTSYSRPASRTASPFTGPTSASSPYTQHSTSELASSYPPPPPPPPPTRRVGPSAEVAYSNTPKSQLSDPSFVYEGDDSEDENEDDEATPTAPSGLPVTDSFSRKADEYPDPTMSNRRPPVLHPHPVQIKHSSGSGHPTAFACSSGMVAVGHSHLKVYDVRGAAQQGISYVMLLSMDQKEMGLEIKHKDSKITALCFRPSAVEGEDARYLWCGSKEGHLWEMDLWGSIATQIRIGAHHGPVLTIVKHKQSILTVDESGKSHLFKMKENGQFNMFNASQTLRLADRQTYVGLLDDQIWTSSGPIGGSSGSSTGSTSSLVSTGGSSNLSLLPGRHNSVSHHSHHFSDATSARRPTIRVYEPFGSSTDSATTASSSITGGRVLPTANVASGAVLCGTIIPALSEYVYLGHEGGQISVWSRGTNPACLSVIKVSTTAIVALIGVGDRLWAGSRKGVITIYDVQSFPWRVTNLWGAHSESPILGFDIDIGSINDGFLTVYSWGRDDCVHAWDGLLAVDWLESRLLERESEFCSYRDLTVLSCSWNIDASKPSQLTSNADNASFLTSVLTSESSPDIIIFGFQELIDLEDKKLQAKSLLFSKSKVNGDMSEKVSQRYRLWYDKLVQAVQVAMPAESPYTVVHTQNLVGLFTCIFVKNAETINLRDIAITTVKRGMAGMFGNKGAIIARFIVDDSSMCFINCHLAAGQNQKTARNADLASILDEESRFPMSSLGRDELAYASGGDGSMVLDHDICFLQGDLNYRIDLRRENVISSLRCGERAYLLEHDQLKKEMKTNPNFRLRTFSEPPVAFDPTYKYNRNSDEYDTSEKKRVPAWCDRILYRSRVPANIEPLHYQRYEPNISDHRPISAGFAVRIRKVRLKERNAVLKGLEYQWEEEEKGPLLIKSLEFYVNL
ncbi:Inositol polyphosphate 5-phosphatase and related proteins [Phaffia rhodozyma]|uniref:Inositol polyphosphate 5-phosphatase and related proteins n=1 Tax=Phaffia rhodozyma TaxID=264483 RepID=A0A0F7SHT0_PHARH|nr:Inositol polyphosphate 5-phosphatase and related proteins [Phaffia rhodozyma]